MRYLMILLILLWAMPAAATYQFFPAIGAIGGGDNLDGLDGNGAAGPPAYEALATGDVGFIVSSVGLCVYIMDATAACGGDTDASTCPASVVPDTNPGDKCWELLDMLGVSFVAKASSEPAVNYYDKEATAGDVNCRSYTNCTAVGAAAETCDWTVECQVAGTPTDKIIVDADGVTTIVGSLATDITIVTPQSLAVTTEDDVTIGTELTSSVVLLTGDNDADHDTLTLQDGTVAGQILTFIGVAAIDDSDTIIIDAETDSTCTWCPTSGIFTFDDPGDKVTLYWTGTLWTYQESYEVD